jgi:hypothetical protein
MDGPSGRVNEILGVGWMPTANRLPPEPALASARDTNRIHPDPKPYAPCKECVFAVASKASFCRPVEAFPDVSGLFQGCIVESLLLPLPPAALLLRWCLSQCSARRGPPLGTLAALSLPLFALLRPDHALLEVLPLPLGSLPAHSCSRSA